MIRQLLLFVILAIGSSCVKEAPAPVSDGKLSYELVTDFVRSPTEEKLAAFKAACVKGGNYRIIIDGKPLVEDLALRTGDLFAIRALLFAEKHCSQHRELERNYLGVELFQKWPAPLITGLELEQREDLAAILARENFEGQGFECSPKGCAQDLQDFYKTKRNLLESAQLRSSQEPLRHKMLEALPRE